VQKKRRFIHRKNFVEVIYRKNSKAESKELENGDAENDDASGEGGRVTKRWVSNGRA
jgi:hypothetical protein